MSVRQLSSSILDDNHAHPTLVAGAGAILAADSLGVVSNRVDVLEFVRVQFGQADLDSRKRCNCVLFAAWLEMHPEAQCIVFARSIRMPCGRELMGTIRHAIAKEQNVHLVGDIGTGSLKVEDLRTGTSFSFDPARVYDLLRSAPDPDVAIRAHLSEILSPRGIGVDEVAWFATEQWRQIADATKHSVPWVEVITRTSEATRLHDLLVCNAKMSGAIGVDCEPDSVAWGGGSLQGVFDGTAYGFPVGVKTIDPIVQSARGDFDSAVRMVRARFLRQAL